jgi:hypothetical protein
MGISGVVTKDTFQDLRSPELVKAHDILRLELFNRQRDAQKELIERQPNLRDYFGPGYADMEILINTQFLSFSPSFLELSSTSSSRKRARSWDVHRRPRRPLRWRPYHGRFDLAHGRTSIAQSDPCASRTECDARDTQINLWKMNGVWLGSGVAGGLGIGAGILGGEGKFHT